MKDKKCLELLSECDARVDLLTDWEKRFVHELRRQVESGRDPASAKQVSALKDVMQKLK